MADIALYYPCTHPPDEAWLKHAVLYWPAIEQIVPEGYPDGGSDAVRALLDARILLNRGPDMATADVGERFIVFVKTYEASCTAPGTR